MLITPPTTDGLLQPGEQIPTPVQQMLNFFVEFGIPARLSRNPVAFGCDDASTKRLRNGKRGIPLTDELKSIAVLCRDPDGIHNVALCHVPADRRLDLNKARLALHSTRRLTWIPPEECERRKIGFGRMNPFIQGVRHVFEVSLADRSGTMMTNAGDRTWAVEFHPADLVRVVPNALIDDIIENRSIHSLPTLDQTERNGVRSNA